jgi:hypothetical protein
VFEKFRGKHFNLLRRVNRDGFIAKEFRIPHEFTRHKRSPSSPTRYHSPEPLGLIPREVSASQMRPPAFLAVS